MSHPNLEPVSSSSIEAWGWVSTEKFGSPGKLFVQFVNSHKLYEYIVPLSVLLEFKLAKSKGTYVNKLKADYAGTEVDAAYVSLAFASQPKANMAPRKPIILSERERMSFAYFF